MLQGRLARIERLFGISASELQTLHDSTVPGSLCCIAAFSNVESTEDVLEGEDLFIFQVPIGTKVLRDSIPPWLESPHCLQS